MWKAQVLYYARGGGTKPPIIPRKLAGGGPGDPDGPSDDELMPPAPTGLQDPAQIISHRPVLQIQPPAPIIGGGEPPPVEPPAAKGELKTEPQSPTAVERWSQAIADFLIGKHGNNYAGINQSMSQLSPRASQAVFDKLPLEHQFGTIEHGMRSTVGDDAFDQMTSPEMLATQRTDPRDIDEAVTDAQSRPQQQATIGGLPPEHHGLTLDDIHARGDIVSTKEFFGHGDLGPSDVALLSDQQLASMWQEFVKDPAAFEEVKARWPDMAQAFIAREADANRILHPEWATDADLDRFSNYEEQRPSPQVNVPQGPFQYTDQRHLQMYNDNIAPHFESREDFAKKFFAGADTKRLNAVEEPGVNGRVMRWAGDLHDPTNGNYIGFIDRIINPAEKYATHAYLDVSPAYRGNGIVPQMLKNQVDTYQKMGLEKVKVSAGLSAGGYTWLKYGFLPSQKDWDSLRSEVGYSMDKDWNVPTDKNIVRAIYQILKDPDPKAAWSLADIKEPTADGVPFGRAVLAGQSWHGTLDLKDKATMRRFNRYVSQKRRKETPEWVAE